MSIYHVSGTGKGQDVDRVPFYGVRVPVEIKGLIKPLRLIDQTILRKLLQVLVQDFEGKDTDGDLYHGLIDDKVTEETLAFIYSGLRKLLQCALRIPQSSLKQEHFKQDLMDLKIVEDFITDLASVVFGNRRAKIDKNALDSRPCWPKLLDCRWRVDVAISTSVLSRVLEPSVLLQMTLSDKKVHSFEVPLAKFHELRFNVAQVLREMETLEKRGILQIQD